MPWQERNNGSLTPYIPPIIMAVNTEFGLIDGLLQILSLTVCVLWTMEGTQLVFFLTWNVNTQTYPKSPIQLGIDINRIFEPQCLGLQNDKPND